MAEVSAMPMNTDSNPSMFLKCLLQEVFWT